MSMQSGNSRLLSRLLKLAGWDTCSLQQLPAVAAAGSSLTAGLSRLHQQQQQQQPLHSSSAAAGSKFSPNEVLVRPQRGSPVYTKSNFQRFRDSNWSYEVGADIAREQDAAAASKMAGHLGQLVRGAVDVDGLRSLQEQYGNTLQQLPALCAAVIIKASQVAVNATASRKAERLIEKLLPPFLSRAVQAAPNDLANVLWALQRLRYPISHEELEGLLQLLMSQEAALVKHLDDRSLAKLAMAAQGLYRDQQQLWRVLEQQIVERLQRELDTPRITSSSVTGGSSSVGEHIGQRRQQRKQRTQEGDSSSSSSEFGSESSTTAAGKDSTQREVRQTQLQVLHQQLQQQVQQQYRGAPFATAASWALAKAGRAPAEVQPLLQRWLQRPGVVEDLTSSDVASLWFTVAAWHPHNYQQQPHPQPVQSVAAAAVGEQQQPQEQEQQQQEVQHAPEAVTATATTATSSSSSTGQGDAVSSEAPAAVSSTVEGDAAAAEGAAPAAAAPAAAPAVPAVVAAGIDSYQPLYEATMRVLPNCTNMQLALVVWAMGVTGAVNPQLLAAVTNQLGKSHGAGTVSTWVYTSAWRTAVRLGPPAAGLLVPTAKAVCAQPEAFTAAELTHILVGTPRIYAPNRRMLIGMCLPAKPEVKSRRKKGQQEQQQQQPRQAAEAAAAEGVPPWCTAIAEQVVGHFESFSPGQLAACVAAWARLPAPPHPQLFAGVAAHAAQHPLSFSPQEAAQLGRAFDQVGYVEGGPALAALLAAHSSSSSSKGAAGAAQDAALAALMSSHTQLQQKL